MWGRCGRRSAFNSLLNYIYLLVTFCPLHLDTSATRPAHMHVNEIIVGAIYQFGSPKTALLCFCILDAAKSQ